MFACLSNTDEHFGCWFWFFAYRNKVFFLAGALCSSWIDPVTEPCSEPSMAPPHSEHSPSPCKALQGPAWSTPSCFTSLTSCPPTLSLTHSAPATLISHPSPNVPTILLPQGFCTCYSLCLEYSFIGDLHSWLFLSLPLSFCLCSTVASSEKPSLTAWSKAVTLVTL